MRHSPISHLLGDNPVPSSLISWVASYVSYASDQLRLHKRQLAVTRKAIKEQRRRIKATSKRITTPNFRITQHLHRLYAANPSMFPGRWRKAARATCIAFQDANRHYAKTLQTLLQEHDKLFRIGPHRKTLNRQSIIPVLPKQWKNTQKGDPHADL
jgi:hypothetical protein